MNVADFAALVGTTSKTIYQKILNHSELPVIEQLETVKEKVKGREVTLIITDSEQIAHYKNLYSKSNVNDGEYYETLTETNGYKQVNNLYETLKTPQTQSMPDDMFDKIITVTNDYNNRLERYNDELIKVYEELSTVKSQQLLLEDKANREGMYINEINELKKENNRSKLFNKLLITVIVGLLLVIIGFIMYNIGVNNHNVDINNKVENVNN